MEQPNHPHRQYKAVNPGDYQANERTYLAWVRTGIGIMAFGFVVVKFSLFIKQLSLLLPQHTQIPVHPSNGYSGILGVLLVVVGCLTITLGYVRYRLNHSALERGEYRHSPVMITVLTLLVFLISIALIIYLVHSIQ